MIASKPKALKAYELPTLDKATWAYIAGFFDGEASFSLNKAYGRNSDYRRITIAMTHTYMPILLWLKETLEIGGIYTRNSELTKNHSKKQQYQYMVHNQVAVAKILRHLLPYLREKQEKAIELIEYFEQKYGRIALF